VSSVTGVPLAYYPFNQEGLIIDYLRMLPILRRLTTGARFIEA
jgi:hypothetical protein